MVETIKPTLTKLKATFRSGKTKNIQFRKQQLSQFIQGIEDLRQEMVEAAAEDLGRSKPISELIDVVSVKGAVKSDLDNLDTYVKDEPIDCELMLGPAKTFIKYEPLGVSLIYGTWNYPLLLALKPLSQAIAAGNCAIVKPSELAPKSAAIMEKLVHNYLDPDCFKVICGDADVSKEIGQQPFDVICFTGSTDKGKLVAQAAAKNLIPCILELGGKCPAVISDQADLKFATFKTASSKFNNSGQTCIAPDYAIVHESVHDEYVEGLKQFIKEHYGEGMNQIESGRMINEAAANRAEELIKNAGGEVVIGGGVHAKERFVEPTIILNPDVDSTLMQEEIFAPILPVIKYKHMDEVIDFINDRHKPLAVYYVGNANAKEVAKLGKGTSSGAFLVNDMVVQATSTQFGFGGVGHSGYGRTNGIDGFRSFSNKKTIMIKSPQSEGQMKMMMPPFTQEKLDSIKKIYDLGFGKITQRQSVRKIGFSFVAFGVLGTVWAIRP